MTSVATPASAEAVTQAGQCGNIAVVGLATPNAMKPYVESDCVKSVVLWNPVDLGYAAVYVMRAVVDGALPPASTSVEAGRLGTLQVVNGSEILLGRSVHLQQGKHQRLRLLGLARLPSPLAGEGCYPDWRPLANPLRALLHTRDGIQHQNHRGHRYRQDQRQGCAGEPGGRAARAAHHRQRGADDGPYPHFDVARVWDFIADSLADLNREQPDRRDRHHRARLGRRLHRRRRVG